MAKITANGGPSDVNANPGDVIEDAAGRVSALHPAEQGALPLVGEGSDDEWLGTSTQPSEQKQPNTSETSEPGDRAPARTTASHSKSDRADSSTARSTDGSTKAANRNSSK